MPHPRRPRSEDPIRRSLRRLRISIAVPLVLGVALLAGCGDSEETTTSGASEGSATTTTTTGELQAGIQTEIDDATASCLETAAKIPSETLSNAAEAACEQIDTDLTNELESSISEAKGNAEAALETLAADCRTKAAELDRGEDVVRNICEAIAAAAQGE